MDCKIKAARLLKYMFLLLVISLLKFFISPVDAVNDLILVLIIWCSINAVSYILLVIYQVFVFLGLVGTLSVLAAIVQSKKGWTELDKKVYVVLVVKAVTFVVHVVGAYLALDLYRHLKAARFGYSDPNGTAQPMAPRPEVEINTDIVEDRPSANFQAFQGEGRTIG